MCYADEMRCEIAATGNYGYYYDDDTDQETNDEWIDEEHDKLYERMFYNE